LTRKGKRRATTEAPATTRRPYGDDESGAPAPTEDIDVDGPAAATGLGSDAEDDDHEAEMEVDPPVETVMPPGSTDAPGTGTVTTIPSTPIANWAEEKEDEVTKMREKRANKVAKEEARRASKAERIAKANMARLAGGLPPAPCASCGNPDHWAQDCDRPGRRPRRATTRRPID
ncbi:hypothetical protein LTR16_003632, partial [Cryomyces antarcticus]